MLLTDYLITEKTALQDPRWFPHDYDISSRRIRLLYAERDYWASKRFLDERRITEVLPVRDISADDPALLSRHEPQLNFIWNTAFCCSTLLADLLEKPGCNLSLREPQIMVKLAAVRQNGAAAGPIPSAAVLHLLARRFDHDEQITIKPSVVVNSFMNEVAHCSNGKMLFLHSDLQTFLLAIARRKEAGRMFAQSLFATLALEGLVPSGLSPETRLSGAKTAALAWHMQMAMFTQALSHYGDRARSLDCSDFLSCPRETLIALDSFFTLRLGEVHIDDAVMGSLMSRHAKELRTYDVHTRKKENDALRAQLGPEFDRAIAWSREVCATIPAVLPYPLCNTGTRQ